MLEKILSITLALGAIGAKAEAQIPFNSKGITPPNPASVDINISAKQSIPAFLEPVRQADRLQSTQRGAATTLKECPMPVHRPDTSHLERMGVAQPPAYLTYSMPRADLKCFNPLDQPK